MSSLSSLFWVIYKPYIGFPSNLNTVVCRVGLLGQSFKLSTLRTLREFVVCSCNPLGLANDCWDDEDSITVFATRLT